MSNEKLKFPLGRYRAPNEITEALRSEWISQIATLPGRLETALAQLNDAQLDTPYRPGGWTVRQVVHHLADSHLNAYTRFKLALTELRPTIKPYEQDDWAKLPDTGLPIGPSLDVLRGLHARWAFLLKNLDEAELARTYLHPEHGKEFSVDVTISMYAHHGDNHLAQITGLRERNGW